MLFRRSLEMGLRREEFLRLLPGAVAVFDVAGEEIRWSDGASKGSIRLVPLESRRLGSVVVPRHRVEITLEVASEADGAAFLSRFHRAFLRGGG